MTGVAVDLEKHDEQIIKLLADIDMILSPDFAEAPEYQPDDQEHRGLLKLARILAKVDFSPKNRKSFEDFVRKIQKDDELEDSELDLAAGGVDLNNFIGLDQNNGKK